MSDTKKIAVILHDRQDEALRMALGLTLEGDEITVINTGAPIAKNDGNDTNVMALGEFDVTLLSVNEADSDFSGITMQELPTRLLDYDHVLPY
ncbi:MAG: hypothetical protein ACYC5A_06840 [Thermoleophilia bacterium]